MGAAEVEAAEYYPNIRNRLFSDIGVYILYIGLR